MELFTIGHGAASLDDFLSWIREAAIDCVVDVRRFPGSRRHPHFGSGPLASALAGAGVAYVHEEDLGGRRRPLPDSPNAGLRHEAFRGYADWMATPPFAAAFERTIARAARERVAVMCSETLWWRCHRRLISDAATLLRGATVVHLVAGKRAPHVPTPEAVRAGAGLVEYPPLPALALRSDASI